MDNINRNRLPVNPKFQLARVAAGTSARFSRSIYRITQDGSAVLVTEHSTGRLVRAFAFRKLCGERRRG